MFIRDGQVLKVERKRGERDDRSWDYHNVHILDDVEVIVARVSDDYVGMLPERGMIGDFEVTARAYKRGGDGRAELAFTLLGFAGPATRGE